MKGNYITQMTECLGEIDLCVHFGSARHVAGFWGLVWEMSPVLLAYFPRRISAFRLPVTEIKLSTEQTEQKPSGPGHQGVSNSAAQIFLGKGPSLRC